MFRKILHFIKYNNLTILILLAIFVLGTGVFAQTETGQEIIGKKQTEIQGLDKTLLLEADLETLDMDFRIEKIEEDSEYYYVTYTFVDLVRKTSAWQYQIQEKVKKVSKKLKKDLGLFLAEELKEEYEARIMDLETAKKRVRGEANEERVEVTKYSGLIGQTLDIAGKIFPGYEPVKINKIPTPGIPDFLKFESEEETPEEIVDNIEDIYNDYIERNDPDMDNIFGVLDNCPNNYNADQTDSDNNGIGDACDITETQKHENTENTEDEITEDGIVKNDDTTTTTEEIVNEEIIKEEVEEGAIDENIESGLDEELVGEEDVIFEPETVEIIELPIEETISEPIPVEPASEITNENVGEEISE